MNERITHYRIFLSIEKEEQWLEQMSRQGYHLIKAPGLGYTFEKGQPEERIYKIDFRFFNKKEDLEEYLTLFEDSDWKSLDPKRARYNFYFYTTAQNTAQKDIFSDEASKAQRSFRYAQSIFYTFLIALLPYLVLHITGTLSPANVGYLTPGLWQMQGTEFTRHFLFETPFVILRVTMSYLPLTILLVAGIFLLRSYRQYQQISRQNR